MKRLKRLVKLKLPFLFPVAKAALSRLRHRASKQKAARLVQQGAEIRLEVGAGEKKGKGGWTTIDITDNCDLYWDLRKSLPFPNACVSKIYSSHFFEHLSFGDTQRFLDECKRVLKPGGEFIICVPNARIYLEAYVTGRHLDPHIYFGYKPAYNGTTRIDYANYTAYMDGEHKYMFDEENLLHILSMKGFKNVRLRNFDPSLDMQERDYESIYAQAEK